MNRHIKMRCETSSVRRTGRRTSAGSIVPAFESLESRRLYSATPTVIAPAPAFDPSTAIQLGDFSSKAKSSFHGVVDGTGQLFAISTSDAVKLNVKLSGIHTGVTLKLEDEEGAQITGSYGRKQEAIQAKVVDGTYYLEVFSTGTPTSFKMQVSSTPIVSKHHGQTPAVTATSPSMPSSSVTQQNTSTQSAPTSTSSTATDTATLPTTTTGGTTMPGTTADNAGDNMNPIDTTGMPTGGTDATSTGGYDILQNRLE